MENVPSNDDDNDREVGSAAAAAAAEQPPPVETARETPPVPTARSVRFVMDDVEDDDDDDTEAHDAFPAGTTTTSHRKPGTSLQLDSSLFGYANNHNNSSSTSSNSASIRPRVGSHMDLVTGTKTKRCQSVQVLPRHDANEQPNYQQHSHFLRQSSNNLRASLNSPLPLLSPRRRNSSLHLANNLPTEAIQYRISSKQIHKHPNVEATPHVDDAITTLNTIASMHRVGHWFMQYLFWTFRTTFLQVTLASFVFYMVLITLFAIGVYGVGQVQPECIVGVEVGNGTIAFADAYHLSWTTLSTVGYGVMAPGLPSTTLEVDEDGNQTFHRCTGINILMALESFVGVLFGGVTGAIIFAKVARIQSIATVKFSDPIVIRFGKGLLHHNNKQSNIGDESIRPNMSLPPVVVDDDDDDDDGNDNEIPCPILEFRMINTAWNQKGGEIMDSTVNLVAARLETKEEVEERMSGFKTRRKKRRKKGARRRATKPKHHNHHRHSHANQHHHADHHSAPTHALSTEHAEEHHEASDTVEKHKDDGMDPAQDLIVPASSSGLSSATSDHSEHSSEEGEETGAKVSLVGTEVTRSQSIASGSFFQRVNQSFISSSITEAMAASNRLIVVETEDGQDLTEPYNRKELERQQSQILQSAVEKEVQHRMSLIHKEASALIANKTTVAVDEGSSLSAARRIFYAMEVETDSHPFFRRTWNIRHVCNENSPLLSHSVRQRIEENDGYWPPELNNYEAIRKAINFHEIIVSFSGTQNVSASSMYAVKKYQYVDMAVGYAFANVLAKDDDENFIVDATLLNDVKPQVGGGEEPIHLKDDPQFVGYATAPGQLQEQQLAEDSSIGNSTLMSVSSGESREEKKVDGMV
mmetsp:Transcript_14051/g.38819  ORF Transcript_14051/g.38819 Transcript_14051/m.38819 type:complete len:867 (+) Transcript_14051:138-2738(+)